MQKKNPNKQLHETMNYGKYYEGNSLTSGHKITLDLASCQNQSSLKSPACFLNISYK